MTLIEQLTAVITAIAQDISNNSGNSGSSDSSDVSVLLPRKIGATQKWYQSGLRYGADYPYPYSPASVSTFNGYQYFVPFTALEDATITALETYCTTAQNNTSASVSLGIYASDSNNDLADPLFTSDPISCSTTGAKNAPCNVQIIKGKTYWLSSMVVGNLAFYRNYSDSLKPIKGNTASNQGTIIGYYTNGNTSMAQSVPINKVDWIGALPRVLFITG